MRDPDFVPGRTGSDPAEYEPADFVIAAEPSHFGLSAYLNDASDPVDVLARDMADCVPTRIAILDTRFRIRSLNAEWRRLDLRGGSALGRDFVDLCLSTASAPDRNAVAEGLAGLERKQSAAFAGTIDLELGGSRRSFAVRARKLPQSPELVVVALLDITDRTRLLAERRKRTRIVLDAEQAERKRIARELHDETAQQLAAMQLGLAGLRECGTGKRFDGMCSNIEDALRSVQKELRTLSYILHPPEIEDAGLIEALVSFVHGFGRRTQLAVKFVDETGGLLSDGETDRAIYRVTQEALTNVSKHAEARNARVSLRERDQHLVLEVEDDGIGIAPELCSSRSDARLGVGLSAMRERIEALTGRLEVYRLPLGTRVTAVLPYPRLRQ